MRYLTMVPLLLIVILAGGILAPRAVGAQTEPEIFEVVEQMPELIGGILGLQGRIQYPKMTRGAGIEGRVFVQFVVNEYGVPSDIRVVRGIGGWADEAAVQAVRESRFTPGLQRGRPVKVRMSLPISVRLPPDGETVTERQEAISSSANTAPRDANNAAPRGAASNWLWGTPLPSHPACDGVRAELKEAERDAARAAVVLDGGIEPPPVSARPVVATATLYSGPDLRQALQVRASDGTVTPVRFVPNTDSTLAVEATFSDRGSTFRVYAAPDAGDVDTRTALATHQDRYTAAVETLKQAEARVEHLVLEEEDCEVAADFEWRRRRAEEHGYALLRVRSRASVREGTESWSSVAFSVVPGDEVAASLLSNRDGGEFAFVFSIDGGKSGWVPTGHLEGVEAARPVIEAYMAELAAEREARDARFFAESPDLLIKELQVTGSDYFSGAHIEFQNLRAGRTIKYARFTLRPYNRVGDPIGERYGGGVATVTAIGPAEPSTSMVYSWDGDSVWRTGIVACIRVTAVSIEYTDGSTRSWRSGVDVLFEDATYWNRCP